MKSNLLILLIIITILSGCFKKPCWSFDQDPTQCGYMYYKDDRGTIKPHGYCPKPIHCDDQYHYDDKFYHDGAASYDTYQVINGCRSCNYPYLRNRPWIVYKEPYLQ